MLFAIVTHKQNSSDYGIYISDINKKLTYFHYLGYFYTESIDKYQWEDISPYNINRWIQLLTIYQFRYKSTPVLEQIIKRKIKGLTQHSKEVPIIFKNTNFGLPKKDTCPICLNVYVPGTSVYSYHHNHTKHWACNDCYHTHNEITQQPCPICRLPY